MVTVDDLKVTLGIPLGSASDYHSELSTWLCALAWRGDMAGQHGWSWIIASRDTGAAVAAGWSAGATTNRDADIAAALGRLHTSAIAAPTPDGAA